MIDNLSHVQVQTNGISLHVTQAGPADGPLLILLHGFPEFWYGWRHQIAPLAAAGYRVWVPDQRGYNLSDKPRGVRAYALDTLAADIVGLIDAAGVDRAHVIGHDWGGVVAWRLADRYPDRLHRVAILNVPHDRVLARFLRRSPAQLRRSLYMFFFQLPWLPERVLGRRDGEAMAQLLARASRPGAFSADDLTHYRAAWRQPGALTAMLNWYRALTRAYTPAPRRPITVPTLLIWGVHDVALGREMAPPSIDRCTDGHLVFIEDAGHFVQHEAPTQVTALLRDWFGRCDCSRLP